MKRGASLKPKFIALSIAIFTFTGLPPANAAVLVTTNNGTGYGYGLTTTRFSDIPVTVPSAATIQSIVVTVVSPGTYPTSGANLAVYSGTSSAPSTLLATLTYGGLSGLEITFTGTVSLPSAGTYWLRFGATTYYQPSYTTSIVTTGSVAGWSVGKMRESTDSGSNFTTRTDNLTFKFTINGTGGGSAPVASSISIIGNSSGIYRQNLAITATLSTAGTDGKVTFYANNKKIPGCISKQSVSLSSVCNWKPSQRGAVVITAKLIPADSGFLQSKSGEKIILVANRAITR
jgi:hypothetical protein